MFGSETHFLELSAHVSLKVTSKRLETKQL